MREDPDEPPVRSARGLALGASSDVDPRASTIKKAVPAKPDRMRQLMRFGGYEIR